MISAEQRLSFQKGYRELSLDVERRAVANAVMLYVTIDHQVIRSWAQRLDARPSTFEGDDAPNPHDVPEAIAELVAQTKGSRPARTVVGAPFGSDEANEGAAPAQAKAVEALGLSHLEKVA